MNTQVKASFFIDRKAWKTFLVATKRENSDGSKTLRAYIDKYNQNHPIEGVSGD